MMNYASTRTKNNLKGVHPDLVMVVAYALAISEQDFFVNEGVRTVARQQELYAQGRTTSGIKVTNYDNVNSKSNHQAKADGYGPAIDVYYTGWKNTDSNSDDRWLKVFNAFRIASTMMGVPLSFGKDWKTVDTPHIELHKAVL